VFAAVCRIADESAALQVRDEIEHRQRYLTDDYRGIVGRLDYV